MDDTRTLGLANISLLETAFADLVGCPFFIKNKKLEYVAANPAMVELCGVAKIQDLMGRSVLDFFTPNIARRYEVLDQEVLLTGKRISNVVDQTFSRGSLPEWIVFSRMPVRDSSGQCVGILASGRQLGTAHGKSEYFTRLRAAVSSIRKKYNQPLETSRLADRLGISTSQLQRDFRTYLGMSPQRFQRQLRIENASEQLATDKSIAQIAVDCGFSDQSALTRCFKDIAGISPGRYRQLAKQYID